MIHMPTGGAQRDSVEADETRDSDYGLALALSREVERLVSAERRASQSHAHRLALALVNEVCVELEKLATTHP